MYLFKRNSTKWVSNFNQYTKAAAVWDIINVHKHAKYSYAFV